MSEQHQASSHHSLPPISWRGVCNLSFIDYQEKPVSSRIYSLLLVITASALLAITVFTFTLNLWYGVYCLLVIAPLGMLLIIQALSGIHKTSWTRGNKAAAGHSSDQRLKRLRPQA